MYVCMYVSSSPLRRETKKAVSLSAQSVCLSVTMCVCMSVCLSVTLCVCMSVCLYVCLQQSSEKRDEESSEFVSAVCLSVCLSLYVCLSVCLPVCLSVCLQQSSEKRDEESSEFVSAVCWRTVSLCFVFSPLSILFYSFIFSHITSTLIEVCFCSYMLYKLLAYLLCCIRNITVILNDVSKNCKNK